MAPDESTSIGSSVRPPGRWGGHLRCLPARWERGGEPSPGDSDEFSDLRQASSAVSAAVILFRRRRLAICHSGYMKRGNGNGIRPKAATARHASEPGAKIHISGPSPLTSRAPPPKVMNPPTAGWMSATVLRPRLKASASMSRHQPVRRHMRQSQRPPGRRPSRRRRRRRPSSLPGPPSLPGPSTGPSSPSATARRHRHRSSPRCPRGLRISVPYCLQLSAPRLRPWPPWIPRPKRAPSSSRACDH